MQTAYVVTGTLSDNQTVKLDEALPVSCARVRLVVEVVPDRPHSYQEVMAMIRERQRRRGHQPRTKEEVDAYLQAERASWDDE